MPFSQGLPGAMVAVFAPTAAIQSCTTCAMELRAVVGADMTRHAAQDEQIGEPVDDVDRLQLARHPDRQAQPSELVHDVGANAVRSSLSMRTLRPSCVRSSTKSYDQT